MKVIICGAGQVGYNIAKSLTSENADVTIIDQSEHLVRRISETLDVRGMVGFASHPDVLQKAGADEADMIIAVTYADEVNMVACQVCHSIFGVPTKIARIRHQSYLDPTNLDLFAQDHMPIDVIISPEMEVARAIGRRLEVPGAFEAVDLADGKVSLVGVHIREETPIINTPLRQLTDLFPDLKISVLSITRNGVTRVAKPEDELLPGDDVHFACATLQLTRAMLSFGHDEQEARRVILIGGGNIGLNLAKAVETEHPYVQLKVIELDRERAEAVAQNLNRSVVINGDALDLEILEEAGVSMTETVIAVSNDDEVNILASLLAKRQGCKRAVTLINSSSYSQLVGSLGIDTVVSPRMITVSTILRHVRRGRIRSVHSIGDMQGEVIEAEALETSSLVGKPLRETQLPDGVIIGALVRDQEVFMPRGDTIIKAGDLVVLYAASGSGRKVEKLFSVKLEFF